MKLKTEQIGRDEVLCVSCGKRILRKDKKYAYGILSYKRGLCENCLKGMVIIENEIKE